MPSLLRMPEVATDSSEATLLAWLIAENIPYSASDAIATVETAKAVVDIEAESDGVIFRTLVTAGTEVKVGEAIALIGLSGETIDDLAGVLDQLGVSMGTAGGSPDDLTAGDPPEIEEGLPAPLPPAGQVRSTPDATADSNGRIFSSPLARRLARDGGLTLAELTGTGPSGRIVRRDVEQALLSRVRATQEAPELTASSEVGTPPPASGRVTAGEFTDHPTSRFRKAVASRLTASKATAPHFYLRGQAEVDRLLVLRTELNMSGDEKISVNDLIIKAVGRAHTLVPKMNVIWTPDAVRQFSKVDVAFAVATPNGLLAPVVRDVADRGISALATSTRDYAERARSGRLQQEDLEGGSITVSNLGMFGTKEFTAIINPPQAAILAVGAATPEPVVRNGKVKVGTVLRVTLSVDHRPVDGAIAAEWMQAFLHLLNNPASLLV